MTREELGHLAALRNLLHGAPSSQAGLLSVCGRFQVSKSLDYWEIVGKWFDHSEESEYAAPMTSYDTYETVLRLARAHVAKQEADEAAIEAAKTLRAAENKLYLPLRKGFTVRIDDKLVTVTRTASDVREGNTYSYLVSTPVEP